MVGGFEEARRALTMWLPMLPEAPTMATFLIGLDMVMKKG